MKSLDFRAFPHAALALSLLGGGSALAQEPARTPEASVEDTGQLGEIVVTAQRREESLARVGISIVAIGGDDLQNLGVNAPQDLVKLVPGFEASTTYGGNPVYILRGIGFNTRNASSTAPVGIYMDEAAVAYPYMSLGLLFDLERVEVLKGPQGTLYGRNATGGLINYVAGTPSHDFEGGLNSEIGTFETFNVGGYVSGPVSDALRARLAVNLLNRGDYQRSITSGEELGEQNSQAVRFTLDYAADGSPFSARFTTTYWSRKGDVPAPQAITYIPDLPGNPLAAFANPLGRASVRANPRDNRDVDFYSVNRQTQADIGIFHPGPLTDSEFWSGALKAGYDFSPSVRLQTLTTYQYLNQRDVSDAGGVQIATLMIDARNEIQSFAQELRLIGDGERFSWSIGGYYADDVVDTTEFAYNDENATIRRFRAISTALPSLYTVPQRLRSFGNFRDVATTDTQVYAAFANAEYEFSDLWKLTVGGRYTQDKTDFTGCTYDTNGGSEAFINTIYNLFRVTADIVPNQCYTLNRAGTNFVNGAVSNSIDQSNFAWRANLDFTPTDDVLLYGSISRGYKSGGFPVIAASNEAQFDPIKQEQLTAYEVGAKLALLDRRAQLNLAAFLYDYKDKQVYGRVLDPIFGTLSRIRNVPESEMFGVEGDLTWRLTPEVTLQLAATYLDSEIKVFSDFTELGVVANIAGQPFTYTPEFQGRAGISVDYPLYDNVNFIGDLGYSYQTETQADSAGIPQFAIDAYGLLDGAIGLVSNDDRWRLSLYGKNITDEYYWVGVASGTETIFRFPGMPREYGVRAAFRF
jgi:outer membrane receptor protein involved in Fe transport